MKTSTALFTLLLVPFAASAQRATLTGFSVERSEQQREWESAVPDGARMAEHHYEMTRRPHHAGTEENYRLALYLQDLWEELGFETELVKYDAFLPWPGELRLRLVEPEVVELAVSEPPIPEDLDTYVEGGVPGVAAYVTPSEVTGDVIYANYGRIGDYRLLDEQGVSLDGRIVLVRYGGTPAQMRGMKVREAAKRGAIGVVIYTDPEEDGFVRGDVYPNGTWRPWEGIQRGSFLDVPIYPGDPLTPFEPSIPGVERLANAEILPFDFTDTADAVARYVDELVELDAEGRLRDTLREIGAANAELRVAAAQANTAFSQVLSGGAEWTDENAEALREINRLIMQTERELLDERGIWRRPWYRNLVYAPGYYEGYAAKTLPGVREAIEEGEWETARDQADMLIDALGRATMTLTSAAHTARRAVSRSSVPEP